MTSLFRARRSLHVRQLFVLRLDSLARMNARMSSAMSSSLVHCSVEGHREAAEAVDRHAALLTDLERYPSAGGALELRVLGPEALELCGHVVVGHAGGIADPTREADRERADDLGGELVDQGVS
jgi:hypothetical protein